MNPLHNGLTWAGSRYSSSCCQCLECYISVRPVCLCVNIIGNEAWPWQWRRPWQKSASDNNYYNWANISKYVVPWALWIFCITNHLLSKTNINIKGIVAEVGSLNLNWGRILVRSEGVLHVFLHYRLPSCMMEIIYSKINNAKLGADFCRQSSARLDAASSRSIYTRCRQPWKIFYALVERKYC